MIRSKLFNFIAFQICWFICVYDGARGSSTFAVTSALLSVIVQNISNPKWQKEAVFLVVMTVLGTLYDYLGLVLGAFAVNTLPLFGIWAYPLWMSALWLIFGSLFNSSLSWMSEKYFIGAVLGALGGPLAYVCGEKLGAMTVHGNSGLIIIGVMWGIITPIALYLAKKIVC